jgi:hypothetical protein
MRREGRWMNSTSLSRFDLDSNGAGRRLVK